MNYRTRPTLFIALGAAFLFTAPANAQDKPPSASPPAQSAHKSFLKKPAETTGKLTVTDVPKSDSTVIQVPEAQRSDSKFLK